MNASTRAVGSSAATALLVIGVAIGGTGSAAAQPGDYSTLPVDPNLITDSLAYTAAPQVLNPNGEPGVTAVYNHRDGGRQITGNDFLEKSRHFNASQP